MKPAFEAQHTTRERHRKQPRAKGSNGHILRGLVDAVGPEEADEMMQDSPEGAKAALRALRQRNDTGKE
jgi:hypothetical protein